MHLLQCSDHHSAAQAGFELRRTPCQMRVANILLYTLWRLHLDTSVGNKSCLLVLYNIDLSDVVNVLFQEGYSNGSPQKTPGSGAGRRLSLLCLLMAWSSVIFLVFSSVSPCSIFRHKAEGRCRISGLKALTRGVCTLCVTC